MPLLHSASASVRIAALALAIALAAACARETAAPLDPRFTFHVDGPPAVDVRVQVSPGRVGQAPRWTEGAGLAVAHHVRMLGRAPATTLTVVDGWAVPGGSHDPGTIRVSAPFLTTNRGRAIERAITDAVARAFWRAAVRCDTADGVLIEGLARYTSTAALVSRYGDLLEPPAIGMVEQRWLGGLFPWVIRINEPAWAVPSRHGDARDSAADRAALAVQTLANRIGTPTFEASLRVFATGTRARCASWRDLQAAASDVSGLDLSWFFQPAFASSRVFDYGVESLESVAATLPVGGLTALASYHTRVVARRYGDAQFTGTSAQPVPPFEAGRGVELRVRFADGTARLDAWDGRAAARTFEYDSAAPAVSATIDPDAVIQLDADRTNNSRTLTPRTSAAAARWSALWMLWLEHALLWYASLV